MDGSIISFVSRVRSRLSGWWFQSHRPVTLQDLEQMEKRLNMTQKQIAEELVKILAQTAKIAKEQSDRFDALTAKIAELTAAVEAGEVSQEVTDALAGAQAALQSLYDVILVAPTT